ncbi:hypothetical protein [Pelistega indica]|uniref:hypothetical protein n=1 Tax=Pelistega indica TaxID=1414851 RepID=UPI0011C83A7D|nr:hypothetical protein [Pelistega indica]
MPVAFAMSPVLVEAAVLVLDVSTDSLVDSAITSVSLLASADASLLVSVASTRCSYLLPRQ